MNKIKILTVVGTRPEIIRLSSVINKFNDTETVQHILVHTGQNYDYELNEVFFKEFQIKKPDYFLNSATGNATETIGNILINIDPILETEKPDALLILGDTNSCLSALAAKRRKIPIFHMEAGNRCFDQRVPEETNRKIVDHMSDINLTYSDIAREYLLREGLPADRIIKTGSPMFEVLKSRKKDIEMSTILHDLNLQPDSYFVVSAHREENVTSETNLRDLAESLNAIVEEYDSPIIVSTHPRTRNMLEKYEITFNSKIRLLSPLGFNDYIALQKNAKAVLSDSGTINEEASILQLKALNIRKSHERPEAMEEAITMMTGLKKDRILPALRILENQQLEDLLPVQNYTHPNVSEKVLRIIVSYINYVNENVWKKTL